jgi:hypothetical protein
MVCAPAKIGLEIMHSANCRDRAEMCRKSAFETDEVDQSGWWLYMADLWDELAMIKEPPEQTADDPLQTGTVGGLGLSRRAAFSIRAVRRERRLDGHARVATD